MRPDRQIRDALGRWWRSTRARYCRLPEVKLAWFALFLGATLLAIAVLDAPSIRLFSALAEQDDYLGKEVLGLRKGLLRLLSHRITDAFTVGYLLVWAGLLWAYAGLLGGRLRPRIRAVLDRLPGLDPLAPAVLPERRRVRAFIGAVLLGGLLQSLACETAKLVFGRQRPGDLIAEFGAWHDVWRPMEYGGSFPSGHATFGVALATIGFAYWPRARAAWAVMAIAIVLARMMLLRHNLSDVLAGAGLGWYIGTAVILAYPALPEEALAYLAATRKARRAPPEAA